MTRGVKLSLWMASTWGSYWRATSVAMGDSDPEDIDSNNLAVKKGDARIFSSYEVPESPDAGVDHHRARPFINERHLAERVLTCQMGLDPSRWSHYPRHSPHPLPAWHLSGAEGCGCSRGTTRVGCNIYIVIICLSDNI